MEYNIKKEELSEEKKIIIVAREKGGTVELEVKTDVEPESVNSMMTAAVCGVYGISEEHIGEVGAFLQALSKVQARGILCFQNTLSHRCDPCGNG